jgi:hypothetical protein
MWKASFDFTKIPKEYRNESCYALGCVVPYKKHDRVIIMVIQLRIMNTRTTDSSCSAAKSYSDWLVNIDNVACHLNLRPSPKYL